MLDFIEMRKRIQKALEIGRLFITISYLDDDEQVQHYYLTHNFPREDIMRSIEEISKLVLPESLETDEESNSS